jgi:uncharacterized protein (DUF305 family)
VTATASDTRSDTAEVPRRSRLTVVLVAIIALAAVVIAFGAGWLLHGSSSSSAPVVAADSVDAGFARDMSTHHTQAVTMAGYERDNTTNPQLRILAFDIETGQEMQVGEMQGWLDSWGLSRESTAEPMSWMGGTEHAGANGLMPGMATFLQLMIHHHQGGLPMAQYALNHAAQPYVRYLAGRIYNLQSAELQQMEQMLAKLGGHTLAAPAH